MENRILYEAVEVSKELPRKAGVTFSIVVPVLADNTFLCLAFNDYSTGKWWSNDEQGRELRDVTHWLKPVDLSDVIKEAELNLIKEFKEATDGGNFSTKALEFIQNKTDYINSLIK